jgi:hypothetical protein
MQIFTLTTYKSNKENMKFKKKLELSEKTRKEKFKNSERCKKKPPIDNPILMHSEPREHMKKEKETHVREKFSRTKRDIDYWVKWKLQEPSSLLRENKIFKSK